ncbi:DUF3304 domain-containing protein [Pseudomonas sp. F1_0610]|uniref:DUF3304 domain-containing protein n=1 Tax=Pseudomonas sp. F1_0610 TaxID=3114284 RepID=UPI0039C23F42
MQIPKLIKPTLVLLLLSHLTGCLATSDGVKRNGEEWIGVPVAAISHTTNEVGGVIVNGSPVSISLSPTGGIMMPKVWRPDFKVTIEWDTIYVKGLISPPMVLSRAQYKELDAYRGRIKARTLRHSITIPVPEYDYYHDFCQLTVHLLTCGQAKVTTSCIYPTKKNYPISVPLKGLTEPPECRPTIPKGM